MFLKAAVLTLALVAITGTRAEVTSDQVANVVWDYFTQLSNNAKEAVEQFQKTDVTQQLSTLFQDKLGDASTYADGVHNKLVPFVVQLSGHLAQETERVKEEIKKELEDLRDRMMPHANKVTQTFGENMQKLQEHLKPYAVDLQDQINTQTQEMKLQLTPYIQRMQTTIKENVDNLHTSMMPLATNLKDKFNRNMEELKGHLTPRANELKATIDQNLEDLRRSLAPLTVGVQEKLNHQMEAWPSR